jgi:prepilin-type N-terminal cleavage/methylation domain-containing protein
MKVNTYTHQQIQNGYSLVELSVALSIVAVVIVAGLLGARQVMLSNTTNNQIRESNQTIAKLRKTMASQTDTTGLTNLVAGKLGAWPNDRSICNDTACTNRAMFSGAFEYAFTNDAISAMAANTGVMYVLYKVPTQACADLVNGLNGATVALYAGPSAATAPTAGEVPSTAKSVKSGTGSNISVADLASGCTSSTGLSDIYAAVQM